MAETIEGEKERERIQKDCLSLTNPTLGLSGKLID